MAFRLLPSQVRPLTPLQCDEKRPCSACIRHDVKCSLLDNPPPAILQREQLERQRERSAAASSASPEGSAVSVISVDPVRRSCVYPCVRDAQHLTTIIIICRGGRSLTSASRPSRRGTAIATRANCRRSTRPCALTRRGTGRRRRRRHQQAARTRSRTSTSLCCHWAGSERQHGSRTSS